MLDISTNKPMRVSTDGHAGPYIMVPVEQLGCVRELLETHRFTYWVDEDAISINGGPEVTVVNLKPGSDADFVQRLLDDAA